MLREAGAGAIQSAQYLCSRGLWGRIEGLKQKSGGVGKKKMVGEIWGEEDLKRRKNGAGKGEEDVGLGDNAREMI